MAPALDKASSMYQSVTAKKCAVVAPALAFNQETETILRALDKR